MAKTDSFFIRQKVRADSTNYVQETIDLGAFVDALGRSVLKIHSVSVQWADDSGVGNSFGVTAAPGTANLNWQLSTQSQSALVYADDRSLIKDRRKKLKDITNIGLELKYDSSSPEHTGTNYGGIFDIIELEAETYCNHTSYELDDAL